MEWARIFDRKVAGLLAVMVVIGGFAYLFIHPDKNKEAVVGIMMLVLGFYFGSSPGSRAKDEMLIKGEGAPIPGGSTGTGVI